MSDHKSSPCTSCLSELKRSKFLLAARNLFNIDKVEEYHESHSMKSSSWKIKVILFLCKFADYMTSQGILNLNQVILFKSSVKGMQKSLSKGKTKERIVSQTRKRCTVMNVNMSDFLNHAIVRNSKTTLKDNLRLNKSNLRLRKFLISEIMINSGARAGAIAGMRISEIRQARELFTGINPAITGLQFVITKLHTRALFKFPVH